MTLERHPEASTVLSIEGDMNIYRAAELKQLLVSAAENATVVHVDLCDVTELDSAGVQLLLLARRTAEKRQHEFQVVRASAVVCEVLKLLDLTSLVDGVPRPPAMNEAAQ